MKINRDRHCPQYTKQRARDTKLTTEKYSTDVKLSNQCISIYSSKQSSRSHLSKICPRIASKARPNHESSISCAARTGDQTLNSTPRLDCKKETIEVRESPEIWSRRDRRGRGEEENRRGNRRGRLRSLRIFRRSPSSPLGSPATASLLNEFSSIR